MGVDADQRRSRLQHPPRLGEGAAHQLLIVGVGLLLVTAVLARLRHRLAPLRRRRQREVFGMQVAEDALQPHVEERRQVGVVDAAVVRRIGDDRVEGLVGVEQLLGVAAGHDRRRSDLGEFAHTECFPVQGERQATLCQGTEIDLREVVDHLQRLPIADCALGTLNCRLPPCKLVERDNQATKCHSKIGCQRQRSRLSRPLMAHLTVDSPYVLDQREQHQQLPRGEQILIALDAVPRELIAELALQRLRRTLAPELAFQIGQPIFDFLRRGNRRRCRAQVQLGIPLLLPLLPLLPLDGRAYHRRERLPHLSGHRHRLDVIGRRRRGARRAHRLAGAGLPGLRRHLPGA